MTEAASEDVLSRNVSGPDRIRRRRNELNHRDFNRAGNRRRFALDSMIWTMNAMAAS